jgi:hypothetical protein
MQVMTSTEAARFRPLYASLSERRRPEDVAHMIREALGSRLAAGEATTLERAARGSLKRRLFGYTSMAEEFARPTGMDCQIRTAHELFESAYPLAADQCANPEAVEAFLRAVGDEIGKVFGRSDYAGDRLSHVERQARAIDYSRRGYNKRFRLLARMEAKLGRLAREIRKREFQMIGKSALASRLTWAEFAADIDTAVFVAYYTARANLRSEFTLAPQQRAFDEIAAMLYRRAKRSRTVNWYAIAHVYPTREVCVALSERQAGQLLGLWYALLQDISALLREVWDAVGGVDRATMIVRRGMDSSTWNNTAGAWNRARDHWIALLYALGLEAVLDACCPGKVMRLMAADLAYLHDRYGSGIDPNTEVWADLPLPWQVLAGDAVCTREQVEAVCRRVGLDPERSGWTAPRERVRIAEFRPTPELVHGVAVSSPVLAKALRKLGVFSGSPLKTEVETG